MAEWTAADIDAEIDKMQAAYAALSSSGAPVTVSVDGVDTTFSSGDKLLAQIYKLKRLKRQIVGTKRERLVFK